MMEGDVQGNSQIGWFLGAGMDVPLEPSPTFSDLVVFLVAAPYWAALQRYANRGSDHDNQSLSRFDS